ncbi:MAG: SsrA-binding protein SmpB [bacterium]
MSTPLIQNKKAYFNYEILERFSAGIELTGAEVKTLRQSRGSLEGAYITVRGGEAFLINSEIPPYQVKNTPEDYEPRRNRKLLLTKSELNQLANFEEQRGLTIVALAMYNNKRKIKLELAVARGKKSFDKRETIKKRESDRDIQRTLIRD